MNKNKNEIPKLAAVVFACGLASFVGDRRAMAYDDEPAAIERADLEIEQAAASERVAVEDQIAELRQARQEKEVVAKAGEWHSRRFQSNDRAWHVQLQRDLKTGKVTGQIQVNGARSVAGAAKVDGQMDGSLVSGVVLDDAGKQLATFSGGV